MVKILKKICIYSIFSLFMILTVKWWLNSFEKPLEVENVMGVLIELGDEDLDGVKAKLGEPKSVHRSQVYTYKDSFGTYDLLIDDKLKNVVVSIEDSVNMNEAQVMSEIGIREDIFNKKETEMNGKKKTIVYDMEVFSKLEIESRKDQDVVEKIKITY